VAAADASIGAAARRIPCRKQDDTPHGAALTGAARGVRPTLVPPTQGKGSTMEHEEAVVSNPFMLLLHPEEVLAAVERSEHLGRLNRRACHPLDRIAPAPAGEEGRRAGHRSRADHGDDELDDDFGVTLN
jgi:hypothetical protein